MLADPLFPVTADQVALTTDEWYTPRWLFDAAGLTFDLDVCAPVAPELRTCPARRFLTVVEDGLTAPWDGLVWCNPPYSRAAPWVSRLAGHDRWVALLPAVHEVRWLGVLLAAADSMTLVSADFLRPDGTEARPWAALVLASRGVGGVVLGRVATADRYNGGAWFVRES